MNELTRRFLVQAAIAAVFYGRWVARPSVAAEEGKAATPRVAIEGYDPVAYFTDGRPVKGSAAFSLPFDEAVYYFANAEHQKMFAADPDRYAPQFSGYCTVGLSMGVKVEADPEAWVISDGKLYVFYSKKGPALFAKDPASMIAKADANWTTLKGQR
ncbi:YHS domain-containing (seleno)protein [Bradyrhizobium erythrophlei]|uniref:YHS domain-containing (seleno)protein n=1 Tax=Bradyrhizobium erythrophlei TaxID=1437360 RepID=UPI0035ED469D